MTEGAQIETVIFLMVLALILIPAWKGLYPERIEKQDAFAIWFVNLVGLLTLFAFVFQAVSFELVILSWLLLMVVGGIIRVTGWITQRGGKKED